LAPINQSIAHIGIAAFRTLQQQLHTAQEKVQQEQLHCFIASSPSFPFVSPFRRRRHCAIDNLVHASSAGRCSFHCADFSFVPPAQLAM
jgi:hypothetical protein